MFVNTVSSLQRKNLLFLFLLFLVTFHIFKFHHISEEVCVLICFFGLFLFFSYFLTKKAIVGLKRTWYLWFLEGFDVFNVSLFYTCYALLLLISNKGALDISKFFSFFSAFLTHLCTNKIFKFQGWGQLFEVFAFGSFFEINRKVFPAFDLKRLVANTNVLTRSNY